MKIVDPHLAAALGEKEASLENVAQLIAEKIRENFRPWSGCRTAGVEGRVHVNRFGMLPEIIALFFQFDEIQADAIASKIRALFPGDVFHRGPLENQTEFRASLTTAWPQFEEEARRKLPTESTIANAICDRILQWAIDLCKDQGMPLVQNFDEESASCFRARKDSHYEIARKAYSLPLEALNAPLPDSARSMRLSRAGQSFFYAGSSTGTCLAELRIPNGRSVTVGKFKFARPCQLIDLRRMALT